MVQVEEVVVQRAQMGEVAAEEVQQRLLRGDRLSAAL